MGRETPNNWATVEQESKLINILVKKTYWLDEY